jgi:hypothetical protein
VRLASAPEKADVRVMLPRSDVHQSQSRQFRTQSAPGVCRGERANYYPHVKRSLARPVEIPHGSRAGGEFIFMKFERKASRRRGHHHHPPPLLGSIFLYTLSGEVEENECLRLLWACMHVDVYEKPLRSGVRLSCLCVSRKWTSMRSPAHRSIIQMA